MPKVFEKTETAGGDEKSLNEYKRANNENALTSSSGRAGSSRIKQERQSNLSYIHKCQDSQRGSQVLRVFSRRCALSIKESVHVIGHRPPCGDMKTTRRAYGTSPTFEGDNHIKVVYKESNKTLSREHHEHPTARRENDKTPYRDDNRTLNKERDTNLTIQKECESLHTT